MMQLGMGVLEWAPEVFWAATPHDLFAAIDGWREKNGGGGKSKSTLSKRDVLKLRKMLDEA